MKKVKILLILFVVMAFIGGIYLGRKWQPDTTSEGVHDHSDHTQSPKAESKKAEVWTCSMHPQIRQPKSGKCPICGMTLIPVKEDSSSEARPRELKLSAAARSLAGIQVAPVERKTVQNDIRMVGKVDYDETRLAYITSWVPGRLDRLFVDYTGVPVKKGDHMVSIYSPEVLTAQEELLQAIQTVRELKNSDVAIIRETARATVEASREKLRLWGLTREQIKTIETSGKPTDHITIYSPIGGIVIHKNAVEGIYVQTGSRIYTIADLTQVWIKLDAYETDLPWLRFGQEIEFYTESYPGEIFTGRIAFIDPVLNEKTRTVKVRVNVSNLDGKLKPNMFVRAIVRPNVAQGGRVIDAALAGKWISPMHPEIVKDEPGICDICGMPLVKAESLGFVAPNEGDAQAPLVIPASAPLITGKRAVVYVQSQKDTSRFEGRVVTLGSRAGDYYIVENGLDEGERVVVNGNFKIDSALQLLAKPSMMSPEGGVSPTGHQHHGATDSGLQNKPNIKADGLPSDQPSTVVFRNLPETFTRQLDDVLITYFAIQKYLSQDNFVDANKSSKKFLDGLKRIDMSLLSGESHMSWMNALAELQKSTSMIDKAQSIEDARMGFAVLSEALADVVTRFGDGLTQNVIRFHCPMAFNDRGAKWLQNQEEVENPYFGQAMLRCGEKVEVLSSQQGKRSVKDEGQPEMNHEGSHRHD